MAQSPNAVREPSMDELLASIREIIEESAGASASPHAGGQVVNGGAPLVNGQMSHGQAVHAVEPNGVVPDMGARSPTPPQMPTLKGSIMSLDSEDSLVRKQEDVPVQAAMNALAERIGLRRQEEVTKPASSADVAGVSVPGSSFPYAPDSAAPNGAANVAPFPVEKVSAPPVVAPVTPAPQGEKSQATAPQVHTAEQPQQPASQPQTSQKQAPFQVHVQPPYPSNHSLQVPPQPAQPKVPAQPVQPSASSAQGQQPVRAKPAPPSMPTAQLAPTVQLTQSSPPVQQMPSAPPSQPQAIAPKLQQQPFPFQPPQQKPPARARADASRITDVKGKWDELEQDFRAEFEKSAELLLRPYIAQWLDEHFHHLFEKILREEIQRLVQNLRR